MQNRTVALNWSRERPFIAAIVAVVAVAHIASYIFLATLAAHNPEAPAFPIVYGDSQEYALLADNLISHHVFSDTLDLAPARNWPPGYPLLLAAVKETTGSFAPIVLVQTGLMLIAVSLVYFMARRYAPAPIAALAALCLGLDPSVVLSDTVVLTDGLFLSLLIFSVYIAFFAQRPRGVARWIALGILLAVATMIRPVAEFLLILIPAAYLLRAYLQGDPEWSSRLIPAVAAYALCALIIVGPWVLRNHEEFGNYEVAHIGSSDLLQYDVRDFLAWKELGASPSSVFYPARHLTDPVFKMVDAIISNELARLTPPAGDEDNYDSSAVAHFILQDPIRFSYFYFAQLAPYFFGSSIGTYEQVSHQEGSNTDLSSSTFDEALKGLSLIRSGSDAAAATLLPVAAELIFWLCILVLALIGLFTLRKRFEAWLFAFLVAYFALLTGALAIARYRIPAEPFLFILAAAGGAEVLRAALAAGKSHPTLAKVARYLVSGVSGLAINVAVYSALTFEFGFWYVASSVIAFLVALMVSFALQKFFAFRDDSPPGHGAQFARYFAFMLFNLVANACILFLLVQYAHIGRFLGIILSNAIIAIWSYFVYDRLVFRSYGQPLPSNSRARISLSSLSLVIPCYNEEGALPHVIAAIPKGVLEIVVADNNSTDASATIATSLGARVVPERVQGYGAALRTGFLSARGTYIAALDADNQYPAGEISNILAFMNDNGLDFVSASRFPLQDTSSMNLLRRIGNWGLTLWANLLFGLSLADSQSGMWVFRSSVLERILPASNDMPFSQELKIRAACDKTIRFAEYRIPYRPRIGESKLFPFRHGVKLLIALFVLRFKA